MRLRNMSQAEYARFREYSIADYAREIAGAGRLSPEEARRQAQREFDDQLPDGAATPGNHVCVIEQDGEAMGYIWYQIGESKSGARNAFLCDFYVLEAQRRKGVATAALQCMEQTVRNQGCAETRLYVWNRNLPGRALYEKCGYIPAKTDGDGMYMKKLL